MVGDEDADALPLEAEDGVAGCRRSRWGRCREGLVEEDELRLGREERAESRRVGVRRRRARRREFVERGSTPNSRSSFSSRSSRRTRFIVIVSSTARMFCSAESFLK